MTMQEAIETHVIAEYPREWGVTLPGLPRGWLAGRGHSDLYA